MLIDVEGSVRRVLKTIPEHWTIYLATVISDGDITTAFIISDRGGELVEEKTNVAFPGASVTLSPLDEIACIYDIFGM